MMMQQAVYLPGNSTVEVRDVPRPSPGIGQVLLRVEASTICGSDIRAIYREHLGTGPEAYQDVVVGHEPCGVVEELGPGCAVRSVGDRVVVYHISGCGQCDDCRKGFQISCTSPLRRAYGWQRDGGHEQYLVADEKDLLILPDSLSFVDGACVACGFGTAYEAVCRVGVDGRDILLVTGLGPVGLAVGLLSRELGVQRIIATDPSPDRRQKALDLGAADVVVDPTTDTADAELDDLLGDGATAAIDASGSGRAQAQMLEHVARYGRVAFVGEGGTLTVDVSHAIIHKQLVIHGSWVTSTHRMSELLHRLDAWGLHPEVVVSHQFALAKAAEAYAVADAGAGGKVAVMPQLPS